MNWLIPFLSRFRTKFAMGDKAYEKARKHLTEVIRYLLRHSIQSSHRGAILHENSLDEAIADLDNSISFAPLRPPYDRAALHERRGAKALAIADYSEGLRLWPTNYVYKKRARLFSLDKKYQAAIDDCTAVLEISPTDTEALGIRGDAHDGAGHCTDAIRDYTAALRITPNIAFLHRDRALGA